MSLLQRVVAAAVAIAVAALAVPVAASAADATAPDPLGPPTLPDLRASAPWIDDIGNADPPDLLADPLGYATYWGSPSTPKPQAIRFHSTFANDGPFSFEVAGLPTGTGITSPGIATMEAFQCARWEGPEINGAPRACARYASVGTMSWDPHHFHVHLQNFARYSLTEIAPDGTPGPVVVSGEKVGFCMQDNIPWSPEIQDDRPPSTIPGFPGDDDLWWFLRHGWYKGCNAPPMPGAMYRQGVGPGWTDTYYSPYPGQQVLLNDPETGRPIPDGEYLVVNEVNPDGRFLEADRSDNRAWTTVRLGTDATGKRTVEVLGSYAPPEPT
ncbi:MAG: hypothetical protein HYU28_01085 [Actinobacteria bacterium]|nr:hypothetical protein [Actinomycetota bacterium]